MHVALFPSAHLRQFCLKKIIEKLIEMLTFSPFHIIFLFSHLDQICLKINDQFIVLEHFPPSVLTLLNFLLWKVSNLHKKRESNKSNISHLQQFPKHG